MIEIKGRFNTAIAYTDALDELAERQIRQVCDQEDFVGSKLRIMPDVHAGKGCTIGTTMTLIDKVVPMMVGVDIGCGMEAVQIEERDVDFDKLDALIRKNIPCGRQVRETPHPYGINAHLRDLRCRNEVDVNRADFSIGTLGGGNHFIEIDRSESGKLWLVIHSGSRHLGKQTAEFYQEAGWHELCDNSKRQTDTVIEQLKAEGRFSEIETTIRSMRDNHITRTKIPAQLAYVEGDLFDDYIQDMRIVQHFATLNRKAMADVIMHGMSWTEADRFTTIHNYIDTDNMILRKGSVSAQAGERLLIPINMRDGSLICIGKGNPDWNYSAPHGAGRLMSRHMAHRQLRMDEYRRTMDGIYTTCVSKDTLDEAPMAYKNMTEIVSQIGPTAEIVETIKPIYNFKAAE